MIGASTRVCVKVKPGLQVLLMAAGLIRKVASTRPVLVSTELEHARVLPRLFHGLNVTFWFDKEDPARQCKEMGLEFFDLPAAPVPMHAMFQMTPNAMHAAWDVMRDEAAEERLVDAVVGKHGPSFVLTWSGGTPLKQSVLPEGIPVVDAMQLDVTNPLDYCRLMTTALQVHAIDSWFLTLADLVGGSAQKFCHAYAGPSSMLACRKKYRRRISIIY